MDEITREEMDCCLSVLQRIADRQGGAVRDLRFNALIAKIYREGMRHDLQARKKREREQDRALLAKTTMVRIQRDALSPAALPPPDADVDGVRRSVGANGHDGPCTSTGSDGHDGACPSTGSDGHDGACPSTGSDGHDGACPSTGSDGHDGACPSSAEERLNRPESCYICKTAYTQVHHFYHYLCPPCADHNYRMRDLRADLTGRTALVTGGRVKIGHQLVLRLLRDGARVIVTTRFPHAAAARFHGERDSADWKERLQIHGLDLRNLPVVEQFACHLLAAEPAIDILIHNAAQTIKRPRGFYEELIAQEQHPERTLSRDVRGLVASGAPSTVAIADSTQLLPGAAHHGSPARHGITRPTDVLPAAALHDWEERADSRDVNSWLLRLDEVSTPELLEVQLVNAIAPFVLNSRLKPLLMRSPHARRFIVNVSAMEGQFGRHKSPFHPHTNMAKAALNMMTCTSAADYAKDGIYMNSVDTGWVTDENPAPKRERKQADRGFFAPLDIVDGMARVYHPIAQGINDPAEPLYGQFLKDFAPCRW